jgi:uncharacterized CHY-type Zn-finger protein
MAEKKNIEINSETKLCQICKKSLTSEHGITSEKSTHICPACNETLAQNKQTMRPNLVQRSRDWYRDKQD